MAKKKKGPHYKTKSVPTDKQDQSQHATCTIGSHCFVPNLGPIALYLTQIHCFVPWFHLFVFVHMFIPHLTIEIPSYISKGQDCKSRWYQINTIEFSQKRTKKILLNPLNVKFKSRACVSAYACTREIKFNNDKALSTITLSLYLHLHYPFSSKYFSNSKETLLKVCKNKNLAHFFPKSSRYKCHQCGKNRYR